MKTNNFFHIAQKLYCFTPHTDLHLAQTVETLGSSCWVNVQIFEGFDFSFLGSLGIVVEDFILWDVVNISHLNLVSFKLICGLALILFSLFYHSMHDSFPRSLPRCCFPSLGLTWWRGSRMRRNIPWRSVSRLGRL